jgi:hypothetical protein
VLFSVGLRGVSCLFVVQFFSKSLKIISYKEGTKKRRFSMKREEAIELLKEIVAACKNIDYKLISLESPSEKANADSEGFELHVKNHFNEADWKRLKSIVQTRGLSVKEYDGWLIIYTVRQRL